MSIQTSEDPPVAGRVADERSEGRDLRAPRSQGTCPRSHSIWQDGKLTLSLLTPRPGCFLQLPVDDTGMCVALRAHFFGFLFPGLPAYLVKSVVIL